MDFKTKMCGTCRFAIMTDNNLQCRQGPPLAFLVQAPPVGGIVKPNQPAQMGMMSTYPPVQPGFSACSKHEEAELLTKQ